MSTDGIAEGKASFEQHITEMFTLAWANKYGMGGGF